MLHNIQRDRGCVCVGDESCQLGMEALGSCILRGCGAANERQVPCIMGGSAIVLCFMTRPDLSPSLSSQHPALLPKKRSLDVTDDEQL